MPPWSHRTVCATPQAGLGTDQLRSLGCGGLGKEQTELEQSMHGMAQCCMVRCGLVWNDACSVWYGTVVCGTAESGMEGHGVARYGGVLNSTRRKTLSVVSHRARTQHVHSNGSGSSPQSNKGHQKCSKMAHVFAPRCNPHYGPLLCGQRSPASQPNPDHTQIILARASLHITKCG